LIYGKDILEIYTTSVMGISSFKTEKQQHGGCMKSTFSFQFDGDNY
jgi:hypothetical protein